MFASWPGCSLIRFETTEELLNALHNFAGANIDLIIHSAAVADYKPEFSFRLEDMADEIARYVHYNRTAPVEAISNEILHIMMDPQCKVNDDTKISSLEPNLTVKLGLTPKIIKSLRSWFPESFICGFKLLEGVSEKELVDAAMKQIRSCNTDIVFANDLANLRKGDMSR
jgi:phosphopantothenate-cysteine ligase